MEQVLIRDFSFPFRQQQGHGIHLGQGSVTLIRQASSLQKKQPLRQKNNYIYSLNIFTVYFICTKEI